MKAEILCRHPDLRTIDDLRCCFACGEPVPEPRSEYEYNGLRLDGGQEIRLIVLLPSKDTDPIQCDIVHAFLGEADFDAVSYTWADDNGNDDKSKIIHIARTLLMRVTTNCEYALRQSRNERSWFRNRLLWIDAICIDQTNVGERNHQVDIMDHIFSRNSCVFISIRATTPECDDPDDEVLHAKFAALFG